MIRITGIVKTANQVRNKLKQGIHPQEVDSLKEFVDNSLQTIENLCQEANTSPYTLTSRSRKAYHYLKSINWDNFSRSKNYFQSGDRQNLSYQKISCTYAK